MTGDTIALHRSAIPKLGTRDGGLVLEVKVGDEMASFCWKHHPLAAPIEISRSRRPRRASRCGR